KNHAKGVKVVAGELVNLVVRVNQAIRSEKVLRTAVVTVLSEHKPRIFEQGLDENNGKIGTYSTRPISIARSRQARDTGRTRFPGGYSEYKKAVGKNPGFVTLRDTDQMMHDYGIVDRGSGQLGLGDRKSTRLNSSHVKISYAVFCLKKKKKTNNRGHRMTNV